VNHTEDHLIFNVNRHNCMAKAPWRLPVMTGRPKASPSERSCEKVDLGRNLSSNNSPSGTGRHRMVRGSSQDLLGRYVRRVQKTVRRHFPRPITSDPA
jgi:hypothetical protein